MLNGKFRSDLYSLLGQYQIINATGLVSKMFLISLNILREESYETGW